MKVGYFTVHKSGSMLVYKLLKKVIDLEINYKFYSANNSDQGRFVNIPDGNPANSGELSQLYNEISSGIVGPLRRPLNVKFDHDIVLVLRDPRDCLVSMFHSFTKIHGGIPEEERERRIKKGIDGFCLQRLEDLASRYDIYIDEYLDKPNVTFLKYEDIFLGDSDSWISSFLDPLHLSENIQAAVYDYFKAEVSLDTADGTTHKRRMLPGEHKSALTGEASAEINSRLHNILQRLNYN
ncbi:sulfotransferase domain-containing protein [Oceanicoccus sp. KOV_DT_Chl]|uniref:sulfotransferase domain-containing protein n=1 Tax=Oceanicoccus sp. KOV_DT_Chl TaxID=1904639 RepID=UPI00135808F4|nr:sulfotransferase domain-containing protein [Oceanicoccus sp. KOV_DT_Chl]